MIRSLLLAMTVGCTADPVSLDPTAPDPTRVTAMPAAPDPSPDSPRSAAGKAYGVSANVLDLVELAPLPSTEVANPNTLVALAGAICSGCQTLAFGDAAFSVAETSISNEVRTDDLANATTNLAGLSLPGLHIAATTLRAATHAWVTANDGLADAHANRDGSMIQGLQINGVDYGDWYEPATISITTPITGTPLAEIRLLETNVSVHAHDASIAVDALHVIIAESADVVVAHAESKAIDLSSQ